MKILYQSSDNKLFETSAECTKHERELNMTKNTVCPLCGEINTRVEETILDIETGNVKTRFRCPHCDYKTEYYNDRVFAAQQWCEDKAEIEEIADSLFNCPCEEDISNSVPYESNLPEADHSKKAKKAYKKNLKETRKALKKLVKNYNDWDYYHLHKIVMTIIYSMWNTYYSGKNVYQDDESREAVERQLWDILVLNSKLDALDVDFDPNPETEYNLYKEIYSKIGENIMGWWD